MKPSAAYLLACLLPVVAPLARAQQDTVRVHLEQVIDRALEVSPDLDAVRARARYAAARSSLARSSRYFSEMKIETAFAVVPGLTNPNGVSVGQLYLDPEVRNDYASLSPYAQSEFALLQPIYTFGALSGTITAAQHGAEAEAGAVRVKAQEVALRVAGLYYSVLLTDALYALTGQATDVVAQAKREIERLLAEGDPEVDEADRYQVLITEQELLSRTREVTETRSIALAALNRQLMMEGRAVAVPAERVLEPLPFVPLTLDEYLSLAHGLRPEIAQARAGLNAQAALVQAARADYYPQLVFGLSATISRAANRHRQPNPFISDSFRRTSIRTGIGFRQNLSFAQTKARVSQAEAQREEIRYLVSAAEQLVRVDVERAYRTLSIAEASLVAQDSSLVISKAWLRVETINFDLDLGSTENLLDAVRTNLELEARYLEAVQRYNMAVLGLHHAVGLLGRGELP